MSREEIIFLNIHFQIIYGGKLSTIHSDKNALIEKTLNEVKDYIKALKLKEETSVLGTLLSNLGLRIVNSNSGIELGAVDEQGYLYINYETWNRLSKKDKIFLLLHEALHVASADNERAVKHLIRIRRTFPRTAQRIMMLYNYITDSINNEILINELKYNTSLPVLRMNKLLELINELEREVGMPYSDLNTLKSKSKEELFLYVEALLRRLKIPVYVEPIGGEHEGGEPIGPIDEPIGVGGEGKEKGERPIDEPISVEEPRKGGETKESTEESTSVGRKGKEGKEGETEQEHRGESAEEKETDKELPSNIDDLLKKASEEVKKFRDLAKEKDIDKKSIEHEEKPKQPVKTTRRMIDRIIKAYRQAGVSPGSVGELIEEGLEEAKVDWRSLLRYYLEKFTTQAKKRYTWMRESRRLPTLRPGSMRIASPNIWVMIDISGSMYDLVDQALAEIREIASASGSNIYLIGWDTEVRWFKQLNPGEPITIEFTGGGTVLSTPLKQLKNYEDMINKNDILIIITDGVIADAKSNELREAISTASDLFGNKILLSIEDDWAPDDWVKINWSFD